MIDGYLLRYFLAVAEAGNFSRAAKRVSVTQPTLSAGIAKLERQLDVRLFDRDRQSVALTPAGSRFLARARKMQAEYELALQDLKAPPEPRVLRVGILITIPSPTVEALLTEHLTCGGDEVLELLDGTERELTERLDRGRLDLALTVVRPHHTRFAPETLARERYLMVLPQTHHLAASDKIAAEELAGDRMVVRRHCEALPEISRFFTDRGVRPRFVLKTRSDQRVLSVVRSGSGIGMMPEAFADPQLRFVPVEDFNLHREVGLLFAPGSSPQRYANSPFVELLRRHYAQ